MTPEEFIENFAEILEISADSISLETALDTLPTWDSINVLSYMMMVDEKLAKQVDPDAVANAQKVSDLYTIAIR